MTLSTPFNKHWPAVVLFDLDGTLVDSALDLAAAVDQTLQQLRRDPAGLEQVRRWVGHGAAILIRRALAGRVDWEAEKPVDDTLFEEALALFFEHYQNTSGQYAKVYPGVIECLQGLQHLGCRMAVVTNKPERFVAPLLKQLSLDGYFSLIVGGDTLPTKKPDPAPLLYAMEYLQGQPANTVMVGDSAADVGAAQTAGIACVAVTYGYNFGGSVRTLGAGAVVDSLTELL